MECMVTGKSIAIVFVRNRASSKRGHRTAMNRAFPEPQDKRPSSILFARRIGQGTSFMLVMFRSDLAGTRGLKG